MNRWRIPPNVLWSMATLLLASAFWGCDSRPTGNKDFPSVSAISASKPQKVVLVLIQNSTITARTNRAEILKRTRALLRPRYFTPDSHIALVFDNCSPEVVWSGTISSVAGLEKEIKQSLKSPGHGNDPGTAMKRAIEWLYLPEQRFTERKIILFLSDLRAEPCKVHRTVRVFPSPEKLVFSQRKAVEVYCFGVPSSRQASIRRAWSSLFTPEPRFHEPGHVIEPEDLGFKKVSYW
jgi:hypothetical protein